MLRRNELLRDTHPFGPTTRTGICLGVVLAPGGRWNGMYIISGAEKFEPRVANRTVAGHVVKEIIVRDGLRVLVAPEP